MQWKLQRHELGIFLFNVFGGLAFYWFVVEPSLGPDYWFKACVPAAVSVCYFLLRPWFERVMGSGHKPTLNGDTQT